MNVPKYFLLLLVVLLAGCAAPSSHTRHLEWDLGKIQKQYTKFKMLRAGPPQRGILYQGSDDQWHYFTLQRKENHVYLRVEKNRIQLREYPHRGDPSGSLGYYYVDPENNFQRVN